MKMKKTGYQNSLKIGILFFGISMLLWNCEKTENLDEQTSVTELHQSKLANFKAYRPKADSLFRTKPKLVELLKSKFKINKEELHKSKTSNIYGFTIDTSSVQQLSSEKMDVYTFVIDRDVPVSNILENYVLIVYSDTSYEQILTTYPITEEGLPDIANMTAIYINDESLLSKTNCGYAEITSSEWVESCIDINCTAGGNHGYGDSSCKGEAGQRAERICSGSWVTTCKSGGGASSGSGIDQPGKGPGSSGTSGDGNDNTDDDKIPNIPVKKPTLGEKLIVRLNLNHFDPFDQEIIRFLKDTYNFQIAGVILNFLNSNSDSLEAKNWARSQLELEVLTKNIPWQSKTGTVANFKYTHTYFDGSRGYFQLKDGSIVVNSSSEQTLTSLGDLRDKYNEFNPNDKFYYIKIAGVNEWAEMLFNPNSLPDALGNLFKLGAIDLGRSIGRYVLPIEDIMILINGKDFDGAEVSRLKAAGFLSLAIVPGSKALKVVGNVSDALFVAVKIGKSTLVVDTVKTGLKVVTDNNIIRFLSKTGDEIARVVNGVMTFKYTGFGGNIITKADKTTTLIGKWGNQLENIWKTGLAKHGKNTGGLNILGEPFGNSIAEIWSNNKKWLDRAISRGDNIRVTANPLDINNVFYIKTGVPTSAFSNINTLKNYLLNLPSNKIDDLGYYGREIRHLFQNGYNFNSTINQFVL